MSLREDDPTPGGVFRSMEARDCCPSMRMLLAQDNLPGAPHAARDFAANNANARAAAWATDRLGAEPGGTRRGVHGAVADGITGYVLSDRAMAATCVLHNTSLWRTIGHRIAHRISRRTPNDPGHRSRQAQGGG